MRPLTEQVILITGATECDEKQDLC